MARGGVNKAGVQTARLALMARGEYPSIDSVRIEMGNTGSKTTIHRYLKELDESDLQRSNQTDIGDELTQLVTHLAQRLQGQAQESIDQAQTDFDASCRVLNEELIQTQKQLAQVTERFDHESAKLGSLSDALLATQQHLQTEQTQNARLTQAMQDMTARLNDKDEQIRSLEEKHLHARNALEHDRACTAQQREQEQQRHDVQAHHLQTELHQVQQHALHRLEDITRLNRDNERLLAENLITQNQAQSQRQELEQATDTAERTREQFQRSETRCALLEERTRIAQQESIEYRQQLTDQLQQNRVLELILIKTELALENLRATQAADTIPHAPQPDQDQD
jgi:uncharacterized protein YukE